MLALSKRPSVSNGDCKSHQTLAYIRAADIMAQISGGVVRFTISVCLASVLAGSTAYAVGSKIQIGSEPKWAVQSEPMPVPADAAGAVFIRRQDTEVHLDDKGQLLYNGYRIKILHPNALQLGNLSLAWNPAAGSPVVHAIKIHREGQATDLLKTASFEILRREDQLEAARLDGNLTAVLRVPDLRSGMKSSLAQRSVRVIPPWGRTMPACFSSPPSRQPADIIFV
ncbi:DUF3857 domain-containing protein [Sphingobium sp. MI1205]|uniref:DUF3857 domain-containing protein n=1 Tax=Sphingobium sp. MI1205 TaxID=407020 RepID=UPI000A7E1FE9|nr:DUF3857 domain-containing protein [Sphingobium sp. MI1205]